MNVVLVGPSARSGLLRAPLWMPVYLPSLAAVLRRAGHRVALLEPVLGGFAPPELERIAEHVAARALSCNADLVVFDVQTPFWSSVDACARAVQRLQPNVLTAAGGRLATLCPDEVLTFCEAIDVVLIGEAETSVEALAGGAACAAIPGLAFRENGGIRRTSGDGIAADLDTLPFPAWDLLDMAYYTRRTPRVIPCIPLRTATLESSRGCTGSCIFCAEGRLYPKPHRFHSARYVVDAADRLMKDYGIEGLYFSDESFLSHPCRIMELCDEFLRSGLAARLRWSAQARADTVTPDILAMLRKAGCIQLEFGIESGSQSLLDAVGKQLTVDQNLSALRLARDSGLRRLAYVVIGLPGETRDDLLETIRFLEKADPDVVRCNMYQLHPGTPAVRRLVEAGRVPHDFWRTTPGLPSALRDPVFNVSAMDWSELRRLYRRLERRAVLPRFVRDYLRHSGARSIPVDFNGRALAAFALRRLCG